MTTVHSRRIIINAYTGLLHDGFTDHALAVAKIYLKLGYKVTVLADQEVSVLRSKCSSFMNSNALYFWPRVNFDKLIERINFGNYKVVSLIANNELHYNVYALAHSFPDFIILHDCNLYWTESHFGFYPADGQKILSTINQYTFPDSLVRLATSKLWNTLIARAKNVGVYSHTMSLILGINNKNLKSHYIPLINNRKYIHPNSKNFDCPSLQSLQTKDEFSFGVVGYLFPGKHIVEIVKGFSLYKSLGGIGKLYLYGKTDFVYRKVIENEIKNTGLSSGIIDFQYGYIPQERFQNTLNNLDVAFNIRFRHSGEASGVIASSDRENQIVIGTKVGGHVATKNFILIQDARNLVYKLANAMIQAEFQLSKASNFNLISDQDDCSTTNTLEDVELAYSRFLGCDLEYEN